MEINLKEKLLTLDRPKCLILNPLYYWYYQAIHTPRLIYGHPLCFPPSSSDKRGAMMELSWLRCPPPSPFPVHHCLNTGNCETGFGSLSQIHAIYGQAYSFQWSIHLLYPSFFCFTLLLFISWDWEKSLWLLLSFKLKLQTSGFFFV